MKRKNQIDELLLAKLKTEQMCQCGEYLDLLVDTKKSIMDEFRYNREMKIPMNEEKYLNRIDDLRERIWDIAVNYLGVGQHDKQRSAAGVILQLPTKRARAP